MVTVSFSCRKGHTVEKLGKGRKGKFVVLLCYTCRHDRESA